MKMPGMQKMPLYLKQSPTGPDLDLKPLMNPSAKTAIAPDTLDLAVPNLKQSAAIYADPHNIQVHHALGEIDARATGRSKRKWQWRVRK